jgi:hypothetical protein
MLRRRAREINPITKSPWIPSPIRGKYDVKLTIIGLWAWACHQIETAGTLPTQCSSMKHFEETFGVPVEMQKYLRAHGSAEHFDGNGRVDVVPILIRGALPLLRKIFSSGVHVKGIEGLEDLDSDFQLARVRKEDANERARSNALANAQLHTRAGIEETLGEPLLLLANQIKNHPKDAGGKVRAILASSNVPKETIDQVQSAIVVSVTELLDKCRALIPSQGSAAPQLKSTTT